MRMAGAIVLLGLTLGCNGRSPTGPGPTSAAPTVTSFTPNTGSTTGSAVVTILGTGFQSGATVTLGGIATSATVQSSTTILARPPAHDAGTVDAVVTNPGGQSGRLTGAFTYVANQDYTLTASPNTVTAGGQLSVSWTAPIGTPTDGIILRRLGDSPGWVWAKYTDGTAGTFTLTAPTQPGQYEFAFFLDESGTLIVRSSVVTVLAGAQE